MNLKTKYNRIEVFIEFLFFGIIFGLVEDLLAVKLATGTPIGFKIVGIVILVSIPFAIIGELIIDKMYSFPNTKTLSGKLELFTEFLIFGVVIGTIEDIIAVILSTGEPFTWNMFWIVFAVAVPFAAIGELVVDRTNFFNYKKKKRK
jgi:hypothetical protein